MDHIEVLLDLVLLVGYHPLEAVVLFIQVVVLGDPPFGLRGQTFGVGLGAALVLFDV